MKNSILMTLFVSAGLALGACSDPKDDATSMTTNPSNTSGADDDGGTLAPGDDDGVATGADDGGGTAMVDESGGDDNMPPLEEGGLDQGFIDTPDGGGVSFECDLFAQDCPAGEKCMPWANDGGPSWNATRCSPLDPNPAQVGDECMVEGSGVSGIDNCDIGLMCWNVDENALGVCEDMCTGSADNPICENPDDVCSIANDGAIVLCLASCDPLIQDCQIENEVCYPINEDWACAPDASGEMGAYGEPCEFINACDQGSVCVGAAAFTNCAGATGCCSNVCDINNANADADCQALDAGQACEPWYIEGMAPPMMEDVGVCALPA
jgi:hypothetical protein